MDRVRHILSDRIGQSFPADGKPDPLGALCALSLQALTQEQVAKVNSELQRICQVSMDDLAGAEKIREDVPALEALCDEPSDSMTENAARICERLHAAHATPGKMEFLSPLPFALEHMASEGAVVVLKLDGPRAAAGTADRYTVVVSGGLLKDEFFRRDAASMSMALSAAIEFYNERVWRIGS